MDASTRRQKIKYSQEFQRNKSPKYKNKKEGCNQFLFYSVYIGKRFDLEPRGVVKWGGDGFDLEILVKGIHAKVSAKPTLLISSIRAVSVESKVAVDPYDARTY